MPHGESWFSVLLAAISEKGWANFNEAVAHLLGDEHGHTWLEGGHVGLQHVFGFGFVVLVLFLFGLIIKNQLRDPKGAVVPEDRFSIRTSIELIVGAAYKMMSDMMGSKAAKFFLPLIGTCALVILFSNGLGLVPGFLPATDNFNTTLAMALVIFFATHIFGVKEHGPAYFKHFLGPWLPLAPLMLPIELISHLARPLTLAIRLAANMTADHMVLAIFTGLLPFVVPIPMYFLGIIVVVVQTLVFCLLSAVYISLAIAHEEH
ncbi:MAG: F0F1 ATP synthase subunit A [Myxococcota bacterium]